MVAQKLEGWSKGLVAKAERLAKRTVRRTSTAHLLLELYREGREVHRLLSAEGVAETKLMEAIRMADDESEGSLSRAIDHGVKLAAQAGAQMQEAHLFVAITRDPRSAAHQTLIALGIAPATLHRKLLGSPLEVPRQAKASVASWQSSPQLPPDIPGRAVAKRVISPVRRKSIPAPKAPPQAEAIAPEPRERAVERVAPPHAGQVSLDPEAFPMLTSIGRNLTEEARFGKIDPVVGRDGEIERVLDVLARRRSNNPILVGPPGVGKTAIVEGLALALVQPSSPLRDRLLIEVSAGSLVSGTGVRGALSKKIAALTDEVAQLEGKVILFIDEIHAVIGTGDGPDDLAHELKAALSRGRLPCVGATTEVEYRRHFEKDAALARRFSRIDVSEPSPDDAVRILAGVAPRYEEHHALPITSDAIEAAVELSVRFLPERHLPDKAIAVLDLAAARARRRGAGAVDRAAIAAVIAEQASVPVERLLLRDGERLLALEQEFSARIVGHEASVRRIADVLRKGAAGFFGHRPLGTFLFLGSTGVGKTEMAKTISDVFFGGGPMTRIDMSEYTEPHSVARLFGAPPGYVGHEEGGQLTEAVRGRPYQLVLLDEIEKAHPEVLLALLPLLDEGRVTDGRGRTVDFKNTIIALTSNLGASVENEPSKPRIGFGVARDGAPLGDAAARAVEAARRALPPELFNRIDEPLHFGRLSQAEVAEITRRMLAKVADVLARERGVNLELDASAIDALISLGGYDAALGARPMKRVIGRFVESPLAAAILGGKLEAGATVRIHGEEGEIRFAYAHAEAAE
jgi:ATP-dependent Clp protease ATP-binding subunit ClpC